MNSTPEQAAGAGISRAARVRCEQSADRHGLRRGLAGGRATPQPGGRGPRGVRFPPDGRLSGVSGIRDLLHRRSDQSPGPGRGRSARAGRPCQRGLCQFPAGVEQITIAWICCTASTRLPTNYRTNGRGRCRSWSAVPSLCPRHSASYCGSNCRPPFTRNRSCRPASMPSCSAGSSSR